MSRTIRTTHIVQGEGVSTPTPEPIKQTLLQVLHDCWPRLRAGAQKAVHNGEWGVVNHYTAEGRAVIHIDHLSAGSDRTIYVGAPLVLVEFLFAATNATHSPDRNFEIGTPEHDRALRNEMLLAVGMDLPAEEWRAAFDETEEQFLARAAKLMELVAKES